MRHLRNAFGTARIGRRQREVLTRMLENDGFWAQSWFMGREDLDSMRGLERKGIVVLDYADDKQRAAWRVTEKFREERLI